MSARRAGRSDSRTCWPSTTCRAATSSHGQSPARRRGGTVMASSVAAVPGRTWWTSKQASTADRQKNAENLTKQTKQSKSLKLGGCHHNSRVNVPKLPFSTRVSTQTLSSLSAHIKLPTPNQLEWPFIRRNTETWKREREVCVRFQQPGLHGINKCQCGAFRLGGAGPGNAVDPHPCPNRCRRSLHIAVTFCDRARAVRRQPGAAHPAGATLWG